MHVQLGAAPYGKLRPHVCLLEDALKQITAVTVTGIHYVDETGNPQFIDFEVCYQNFLADRRKRLGDTFDEEFYSRHKSVGFRRSLIRPQSLWFWSDPPTDFEFTSADSFWQVLAGIKKAGYRTTDGD